MTNDELENKVKEETLSRRYLEAQDTFKLARKQYRRAKKDLEDKLRALQDFYEENV